MPELFLLGDLLEPSAEVRRLRHLALELVLELHDLGVEALLAPAAVLGLVLVEFDGLSGLCDELEEAVVVEVADGLAALL